MGPDRSRSPEKSDRKPAKEREITPSGDPKAVSTQNDPVFRGVQPHKEWNINDGRKRIDIVYTNAAKDGFFAHRRDAPNTLATMVIVECKNYSSDIENPEIDQLLGRFDNNRGNFGIITCRGVDKPKLVLAKCRDLAKAGRGFILVLTDEDLLELLDAKSKSDDERMEALLHTRFREIIS